MDQLPSLKGLYQIQNNDSFILTYEKWERKLRPYLKEIYDDLKAYVNNQGVYELMDNISYKKLTEYLYENSNKMPFSDIFLPEKSDNFSPLNTDV